MPTDPRTGLRKAPAASLADPRTGLVPVRQNEFQKGLRSGLNQVSSITSGLEGAAQAFVGDNEAADAAVMESQRFQEEAQQFGPNIQTVDDVHDIDSFTDWAIGALGQQLPIMGSMLLGGPTGMGVKGAVRAALPKAALPTTAAAGTAGMVTGASALETGSIFPELQSDPHIRDTTTPRERALTSLGFGTVAGSLEALPFIGLTKRFGVDKAATGAIRKSVGSAIAKGTLTQAALEAGTEGAQTVVERGAHKFLNENADIFSEEGLAEMRNAIATGGLLGGSIGGFGGAVQGVLNKGADNIDTFSDTIDGLEISDQLGGAKIRNTLDQLRTRFSDRPEVMAEIDTFSNEDMQDPDVRKQALKFSQALSEISTTEDVLKERGILSDTDEQMNDVLTISEYARDPELIDTDVLDDLDIRYGSDQGSVFDIIEDIRERMDPQSNTREEGEAALTSFEEDGDKAGNELEADFDSPASYVTSTEFRATVEDIKGRAAEEGNENTPHFNAVDITKALTSSAATTEMDTLVDDDTGITGFGDKDEISSGGFVYTKTPLSEAVVESVKTGKTKSLDMRDRAGRRVDARPVLVSEGGKFSAEQIIQAAAKKIIDSKLSTNEETGEVISRDKELWQHIKPNKNSALDAKKVEAFKQLADSDPKQFLSKFFVIKKQKMLKDTSPILAADANDTTVTFTGRDVSPSNNPKIKKGVVRFDSPNKGSARSAAEATLIEAARKPVAGPAKKGAAAPTKVVRKEKQRGLQVNFPSMISRVLTQRAKATKTGTKGHDNLKNISSAFSEGMTSLFADHGLVLQNISKLPDDKVIFVHKRKEKNEAGTWVNKVTTLGMVRQYLRESTEARSQQPDFHAGVESASRSKNKAIEAALIDLFEANKQGGDIGFEGGLGNETRVYEGGEASIGGKQIPEFDLEGIGKTDIANTIEGLLTGRTVTDVVGSPSAKPAKAQGSDTGRKVAKPVKITRKKKKKQLAPKPVAPKPLMPSVLSTAAKWRKSLGLKNSKLLSVSEAVEVLKAEGRADLITKDGLGNEVVGPRTNGFASAAGIYINPNMTQAAQLEALAHEVGHLVVTQHMNIGNAGPMYEAFNKWREDMLANEGARRSDVAKSKMPIHLAARFVGNRVDSKLTNLSKDELDYLLSFEEWFADNAARFLADETIVPKNAIDRFFKQLVAKLRKLFKDFKGDPDTQVAKFLTALQTRGSANAQDAAAANQAKETKKNFQGIKFSKTEREYFEDGMGVDAYIAQKDINDAAARSAIARWMDAKLSQQEKLVLTNAFKVPHVRAKIEELTGSMAGAPLQSLAAGVQLWNAGIIEVGPKTETVMQKFLAWIKQLLQINTTANKAEHIMSALIDADVKWGLNDRSFDLKQTYKDTLTARITNTLKEQGEWMFGHLESFTYTADSRMQDIPALQEIAKLFHARVGNEKGTATTYFEARATNVGKFTDRVERIFEHLDEAGKKRVLKHAQEGYTSELPDTEQRAVNDLRKLFNDMYAYAEANGVSTMVSNKDVDGETVKDINPIQFRKKYFPVMYDVQYMMDNRTAFIAMLSQKKYAKRFTGGGAPESVYTHLVENMGYGDTPTNTSDNRVGFTPAMSAVNQRTLDWIEPKDRAPFLNSSLEYTMVQYIDSLVKRAEYTKRFDTDGRHLEELLNKAKASGATPKQMKMAENYVNAALGTLGKETNNKLYDLFGKAAPPGQVINPTLQKAMSSVIVFRNLAILGLSMFTSMADVVGITVRSGDLDSSFKAYKQGLQEIQNGIKNFGKKDGKLARSEMSELARGLGVIDTHMTNEALEYQYGGTYMSANLKKVNEAFFRAIGLTQLTKLTRVMALASAKNFIKKHHDGKYSNSERFMEELGLQAGDVTFNSDGEVAVLTRQGREVLESEANAGDEVSAAKLERDDRVRNALFRWVDGAILRPNAAQRPIWASDPHAMLFFHLKSFMYSMHDRILRRAWTEFSKHGNLAPAAAMMMYVPAMVAIDAARDWIKFGFDGSPRKANWSSTDYALNAINRSGIAGVGSMMLWDAKTDRDFGGIGLGSLTGAAEFPVQIASGVLTGNQSKIERALPGASIWRTWTQ